MSYQNLLEEFAEAGHLALPEAAVDFAAVPWAAHPSFAGVELKQLVSGAQTEGKFSYHLVRIAPGGQIGLHTHPTQLETHEVIAGSGFCLRDGQKIAYEPGVISLLPANVPHEVQAGDEGLYLFAKFIPALS